MNFDIVKLIPCNTGLQLDMPGPMFLTTLSRLIVWRRVGQQLTRWAVELINTDVGRTFLEQILDTPGT